MKLLRAFYCATRRFCTVLCIALACFVLTNAATARDRWTPEQAWSWYNSHPHQVGANYVMGYAATATEMWQADVATPGANTFDIKRIRFELDKARETGFNTLRVTLSYEVWKDDRVGFQDRVEQFVVEADKRGIKPAFIFWDDVNFTNDDTSSSVPDREPYLGEQADPVPGMHNSQWTGTGGAVIHNNPGNWESNPSAPVGCVTQLDGTGAKAYVQDIIGRYASDARVLMWNVYNEPNNGTNTSTSTALIHATAAWAREMNPVQPISFDVWGRGTDSVASAESDVISYHSYSKNKSAIAGLRGQLSSGRPVFLTEWMSRTNGNTVLGILPYLHKLKVGAYNWGLVNGDQQTHWAWNSPSQTNTSEPSLWFHDLYRSNGDAYNVEEIALFNHYRQVETLTRSADSRFVTINNASFEASELGNVPDTVQHLVFDGWKVLQQRGPWVGGTIVPETGHFNEPLPDGSQAIFALDVEIGQELQGKVEADTFYLLQVGVGHRNGRTLPDYDIGLYAGGVELTPISESMPKAFEGEWLDASKIYQFDADDPSIGQHLEVRLSSPSLETFFDDVRLTALDSIQETGQQGDLELDGTINGTD